MLPHTLNTTCTSVTSIEAAEDQTTAAASGSTENTKKGTKRKNAKYETFPFKEEQYLVNLWKENLEQLESKHSRKVWTKIVDELNAQFGDNRTVDKPMRKMKYIIDKYTVFSLTWSMSMFFNQNKWKILHKNKVQFPED